MRNKWLPNGRQVAQKALGRLLNECKFDDIPSGSPILREVFDWRVELVFGEKSSSVNVMECETCSQSSQRAIHESIQKLYVLMTQNTIAGTMYGR